MNETDAKSKFRGCLVGCLTVGLLVVIVPAGLIGALLFGPVIADLSHRRAFDALLWRTEQTAENDTMWPPRLRMVDDLMSSGRLDGLSKEEILTLLGQPEKKGFPGGAADCDVHYFLGPERGLFRIDSEWLFITFGPDGKVERCWLYTD